MWDGWLEWRTWPMWPHGRRHDACQRRACNTSVARCVTVCNRMSGPYWPSRPKQMEWDGAFAALPALVPARGGAGDASARRRVMKNLEQHAGCSGRKNPRHLRINPRHMRKNPRQARAFQQESEGERARERASERERERERERAREGAMGGRCAGTPLRQGVPVLRAPPPRALQQGAEVPI